MWYAQADLVLGAICCRQPSVVVEVPECRKVPGGRQALQCGVRVPGFNGLQQCFFCVKLLRTETLTLTHPLGLAHNLAMSVVWSAAVCVFIFILFYLLHCIAFLTRLGQSAGLARDRDQKPFFWFPRWWSFGRIIGIVVTRSFQ